MAWGIYLPLAIMELLVGVLTALIILALGPLTRAVAVLTNARQSMRNRTHYYNAKMFKRL
jgi:hypothetical protein